MSKELQCVLGRRLTSQLGHGPSCPSGRFSLPRYLWTGAQIVCTVLPHASVPPPVSLAFLCIRRNHQPSPFHLSGLSAPSFSLSALRTLFFFFYHAFTFWGVGGGLPVLPPLQSPSPVKPPPVRHRNSPSCEMKVAEFKIAARYYLYSSRKDVFLCNRLFGCGIDSPGGRRLLHCINISPGTSGQ